MDEYQDTNKVQDLLLRTLYPDRNANLFVVADDDQTIYQWNGASPERLRRLQHDYEMRVVQLPESFQVSPPRSSTWPTISFVTTSIGRRTSHRWYPPSTHPRPAP